MKSRSSARTVPISESYVIGGIYSSSGNNKSSDEDFLSKQKSQIVEYKERPVFNDNIEEEQVVEVVVLDNDAPLSPCLLPVVWITP